jgi:hypothetical protein
MTHPQVIQGTGEELLSVLHKHRNRRNMLLIIPVGEEEVVAMPEPTAEEIAAANARLRRHITHPGFASDLRNEAIDDDLAREYGDDHSVQCRGDGA